MSTDEQQNALLNNSQQDIASTANMETRTIVTGQSSSRWSRTLIWTGVSVLAAMLIAGQVASVMFLLKQQDKITELQKTTNRIEDKYRGPARPKSTMHLRPMMIDMPIAYIDPKMHQPKAPEPTAAKPMSLLEQVQELLQKENGTEKIPEFNHSFSTNLNTLKESMKESDWKDFESWLRNWLLFQLMQQEDKKTATTSAPQPKPEPQPSGRRSFASVVMKPMMMDLPITTDTAKETKTPNVVPKSEVRRADTDCERRHNETKVAPGTFRPSCDEMGNYEAKQCWPSTGYCWCAFLNGTKVTGTATRFPLTGCESYRQATDLNISGMGAVTQG